MAGSGHGLHRMVRDPIRTSHIRREGPIPMAAEEELDRPTSRLPREGTADGGDGDGRR